MILEWRSFKKTEQFRKSTLYRKTKEHRKDLRYINSKRRIFGPNSGRDSLRRNEGIYGLRFKIEM